MNLAQIKAFVILAECLNVTETAARLYCTQPAVSIKIKKLEESLGIVLFERISNRLYLTEQGKIFQQYACEILHLTNRATEHIRQHDDSTSGQISLGASHFVGVYLMPTIISHYKKRLPNVEFSLNILPSKQLIEALSAREVDFLVMSDQVYFSPEHYYRYTFFTDDLILIASPEHPLTQLSHCRLESLTSETFLSKPSQSQTQKFLLKVLGDAFFSKIKIMEINSIEGIKHCVMNNLGIAFISRFCVQNELKYGELIAINLHDLHIHRGISYIYHKERYLSPVTKQFLNQLKQLQLSNFINF